MEVHNINSKKKTKQNRDLYLKLEIWWYAESFWFITFHGKWTEKTCWDREDTKLFIKGVADATN